MILVTNNVTYTITGTSDDSLLPVNSGSNYVKKVINTNEKYHKTKEGTIIPIVESEE